MAFLFPARIASRARRLTRVGNAMHGLIRMFGDTEKARDLTFGSPR